MDNRIHEVTPEMAVSSRRDLKHPTRRQQRERTTYQYALQRSATLRLQWQSPHHSLDIANHPIEGAGHKGSNDEIASKYVTTDVKLRSFREARFK